MKTLQTLICVVGITFIGCSQPDRSAVSTAEPGGGSTGSLSICCTTNIVKDLVRQIGGDHVHVTAIMDGPGVDPHLYTPSPQDINTLTASDVVVYAGLHLEAQMEEALKSLGHRGIPAIALTKVLEEDYSDRLLHSTGAVDPHVWFDLELWSLCGLSFAEQLAEIDSDNAADYRANAERFQKDLTDTVATCRTLLAGIPTEQRVLVTAHDAFHYFARAFDFRVEAIQGLSTESEPGLKRINRLAKTLHDLEIGSIFTEQSVSDRSISAVIAACRSDGHTVTIGGRLYSDTAGAAGTAEETLAGATLHNVRQIAKSLDPANFTEVRP